MNQLNDYINLLRDNSMLLFYTIGVIGIGLICFALFLKSLSNPTGPKIQVDMQSKGFIPEIGNSRPIVDDKFMSDIHRYSKELKESILFFDDELDRKLGEIKEKQERVKELSAELELLDSVATRKKRTFYIYMFMLIGMILGGLICWLYFNYIHIVK